MSERYNSHVQRSRRNTVNLSAFYMLFVACLYILLYEAGLDIENDQDQPAIQYIPCFLAIWFIIKPLLLFTYFDDMILTY